MFLRTFIEILDFEALTKFAIVWNSCGTRVKNLLRKTPK